MKKLMILMAMLAMMVVFVIPAVAQDEGTDNNCPAFIINPAEGGQGGSPTGNALIPTCTDVPTTNINPNQEFDQNHNRSGAVTDNNDTRINGNGNTVNSSPQQNADSGNVFNQQGNEPTNSTQEDVDFTGSTSENNPSETVGS